MRARPPLATLPGMKRTILPLALGALALTPAIATAAKPQGTYSGSYGADDEATAMITVDKGKVTGLSVSWLCNDERTQATLISNAGGQGGATLKLKSNRFTLKRAAQISQGAIGEPGFKEGKGSAAFTMTFSGSSWKGTVKASGLGCSTSGSFTATRT
jgi:hypothetical protein